MYITNIIGHAQICLNDYFAPNSFYAEGDNFLFLLSLAWTIYEVENPWCVSFCGEFVGV